MTTRSDTPDLAPPAARPAPSSLRTSVSALTTGHPDPTGRAGHGRLLRTVVAAGVAAAALAGAVWLMPTLQGSGPAGGPVIAPAGRPSTPATPSTPSTPPTSHAPQQQTAALQALSPEEVSAQRESCLAGPQVPDGDWTVLYAQRMPVLNTADDQDVLLLDDGTGFLTCIDGTFSSWSRHGAGAKSASGNPSPATPAVVRDGVFAGSRSGGPGTARRMRLGLQVTDQVAAGQVRVTGPDGAGDWIVVPARQGWVLAELEVPDGATVTFRAEDASGEPVAIGDVDGTTVTELVRQATNRPR
ncbi:hypothetical protein [Microlunatus sp. Y2014]|uniref:hypothetical protein n=1 Tax=Microlunatus sp. Y2014 TaxID=3418488 RepID=UPI003DA704A3